MIDYVGEYLKSRRGMGMSKFLSQSMEDLINAELNDEKAEYSYYCCNCYLGRPPVELFISKFNLDLTDKNVRKAIGTVFGQHFRIKYRNG